MKRMINLISLAALLLSLFALPSIAPVSAASPQARCRRFPELTLFSINPMPFPLTLPP